MIDVNEVFGTHVSIRWQWIWLIPIPVVFPDHLRELILGYRMENAEELSPLMSSSTPNSINSAITTNATTTISGEVVSNSLRPTLKSRSGKRKVSYLFVLYFYIGLECLRCFFAMSEKIIPTKW